MGRRRSKWTWALIEKRIAQGRGQGEGAAYCPWHFVQDFPSQGRSHRIKGLTVDRVHHLLSDLEANAFFIFDLPSNNIIDIREQYPLLPVEETLEIAKNAGVKHPADPCTRIPTVLTTDFLLTIKRALIKTYHARTMKYEIDLDDPRIIEKFEIERRYWEARHVNWGYITEKDIPMQIVENARFLHPYYFVTDLYPLTQREIRRIGFELHSGVRRSDLPLYEIARACDQKLGLRSGQSLAVARHLLARGVWKVNLKLPINFYEKLTLL
ncbi:MAG: TnsA endonuclease N-terminal domain-containing protein [Chitinophagaceae bacterium]